MLARSAAIRAFTRRDGARLFVLRPAARARPGRGPGDRRLHRPVRRPPGTRGRLVPAGGARGDAAVRLDLAFPAADLESSQRPPAHRLGPARCDSRDQGHRRSAAAAVRAADCRGRPVARGAARCRSGAHRDRPYGLFGGAITGSVEFVAYVLLGSMAGVILVRRGERFGHFAQAAVAIGVVNTRGRALLAARHARPDRRRPSSSAPAFAAAAGSAVAALGSFVVLGNLFGITTSFQLLELANPSQPLLRRLLLETPGTYHHSLMVGNLAERAAEAIGADPLLARVAAYYHDIGKMKNPLAFIENQAGWRERPRRADARGVGRPGQGARRATASTWPTSTSCPSRSSRFIPQHHGTALISYFHARAEAVRAGQGPRRGGRRRPLPPRRAQAAVARGGHPDARRWRRGIGPLARLARRAGDPGDGRPDHPRAARRRPVRRVRPDAARPRAHPRGVRGPAAGHVPPPHRVPAEQDRRARVAPRGGQQRLRRWPGSTCGRGGSTWSRGRECARRLRRPPWRASPPTR